MSHYEERLEQDLANIHDTIRDFASLVETAFQDAMHALLDGDMELANLTVLRDNRINRVSRNIDRLCHAFIARHLPGAGHLRMISSVIRLNVALERVGDYAVTISRESLQLSSPPKDELARKLRDVADESKRVLNQAIQSFVDGNAEMAAVTIPMTEHIENIMDDIYGELTSAPSTRNNREVVAAFVIFSLLKRISDQGKNICEQTLFAVAGEQKKTRPFHILFVDSGNNERSLIAQALARKNFAKAGTYESATPEPKTEPDADTLAYLDSKGFDTQNLHVGALDSGQDKYQNYDIIISLDAPIDKYIDEVAFHTTTLTWDVDSALAKKDTSEAGKRYRATYRYLRRMLDDLMDLIAGDLDE